MPNPSNIVKNFKPNLRYYISFDLKGAYWQVPLSKESRSFITTTGRYWWRRMPMGLALSLDIFNFHTDSRIAEKKGLTNIMKNIDDLFLFGEMMEELLSPIRLLFEVCRKSGFMLAVSKVAFAGEDIPRCPTELTFAGYSFGKNGISKNQKRWMLYGTSRSPPTKGSSNLGWDFALSIHYGTWILQRNSPGSTNLTRKVWNSYGTRIAKKNLMT